MKKHLTFFLVASFLLFSDRSLAQLIINTNQTPLQLAQKITGQGVKIINPTIVCGNNGYGSYTANATNLNSPSGVILTSGLANDAVGPNNVGNKTVQVGTPGDPLLNNVTGRTTYDACVFEFDVIPQGDTLKFKYTFASEEYAEWVNSQYNDVFGFFISGPGITGQKNIAIIPGGAACTINNVNFGTTNTGPCTNCAYYVDNQSVPGQTIQYDGFTKNLQAISVVQPCQTYHLKLVIADASDRKYDSGVFIEEIESNNVALSYTTQAGIPQLIEGCNAATVTFTRSPVTNKTLSVPFSVAGTAIKNTDYTLSNAGSSVFFPANVATASITVTPINDGIAEGIEGLTFYLGNPLCTGLVPTDSLKLEIHDSLFVTITPPKDSVCQGQSTQLTANTAGLNFSWTPALGLNSASIKNPIAAPSATTTYTLTTTAGACSNIRRVNIKVGNLDATGTVSNVQCNGASTGSILLTPTGGLGTYNYSWSGPGVVVAAKNQSNLTAGNYAVTITDGKGCSIVKNFTITQPAAVSGNVSSPTFSGGFNISCNGASSANITTNPTGGTTPYTFTWTGPSGFNSNLQSPSGLSAGTYCVVVKDANGCSNTTGGQCITLTQPAAILSAVVNSSNQVSCFGQANGSATVSPSGGTLPYSYTWTTSPVQNTATASNMSPGSYNITVQDANACIATAQVTITQPAAALTANLSAQTNVACFGGSTGSASVLATGGSTPYTYSWSNGQTAATASGLPAGAYTVTVKDVNNCSFALPVIITQPNSLLSASIVAQTNVLCKGQTSGSATVLASGGSGVFIYSWSNGQTSATASNLAAGNYNVTVSDNNGCGSAVNLSVAITEPNVVFNAVLSAKTNVFCKGACTGSASILATGGSGNYSYSWTTTPVQTSATASNLCAGSYQVTVRDANGCLSPLAINVSITEPTLVLNGTIGSTNIPCFGGNTGSVTVNPSGGSGIYDYSWTGPSGAFANNLPTATGLPAGVYTVRIFDRNGCATPKTLQTTITQPSGALSVSIPTKSDVVCFGGNTGLATALVTGGSGAYTISWNTIPSQNGLTASALTSGTYTVFASDQNGCATTASSAVTIAQPAAPLTATTTQTNVACNGGATGVAGVIASGGSGSYAYSWITGAASTSTITGLNAGTYTVYIRDNNSCPDELIKTIVLTEPSISIAGSIIASTDVYCFGGSTGLATALGTGGSGAYFYTWNNGQSSATAVNLSSGNYTVEISDQNGCANTVNLSVIISQPASLLSASIQASDNTSVSCFGLQDGQLIVTAQGGSGVYDYSWSGPGGAFVNNSAVAANLAPGNYTVQVFDQNGCITPVTVSATIAQPAAVLSAAATSTNFNGFNIACNGGTTNIDLTVTGGNAAYTYTWNGPSVFTASSQDISNALSGLYTVEVNDSKGCSATTSINLTEPTDDSLAFVMTPTLCAVGSKTGSIALSPFGGVSPYSFNWNGPGTVNATAQNLSLLDNGTYTVVITDANGCKDTTSITVTQPSSMTTTHSNSTYPGGYEIQCYGGSNGFINTITTGGTPPYSRAWTKTNPGGLIASTSASISGLSVGTYELLITDKNGCIDNELVVMTEPDSITSNLSVSNTISCLNASSGCLSTNAIGGVPPYTYIWSGPGAPFPSVDSICNLGAGSYSVLITDANGCSNPNLEQQIVLPLPSIISAIASVQTPILCNNQATGKITLVVTGGLAPFTYTWTGPSGFTASTKDIVGVAAGLYNVTVEGSDQCTATTSISISQPPPILPIASISNNSGYSIPCFGGNTGSIAVQINGGTGPYTYTWAGQGAPFGNVDSIGGLTAGTYTLRVDDAQGCFSADTSFVITQPDPLFVNDSIITLAGCNGLQAGSIKAIATGGSGGYSYSWNTTPPQLTQIASGLEGGTYTAFVVDANNCAAQASIFITTLPTLDTSLVSSSITQVLCNGAATGSISLSVNGGLPPFSYTWTPSNIGNIPNPSGLVAGNYSVVVTDANNCSTIAKNFTINQPSALSLIFSGNTQLDCLGGASGTLTANVLGGTAPYTYAWSGTCVGCPNTPNLTGLSSGTYNLTVSDANACVIIGLDSITQPLNSLSATLSSATVNGGYNITCNGANTGSINLQVSGGTAPYTFTWTASGFGPVFTQNLTGLKAKTYTVIVKDAKGCSTTTGITLTQPSQLSVSSVESVFIGGNNISCNGALDGCIDVTASGGTAPYSYAWIGPASYSSTLEDVCNLRAGIYILTVTDANGCQFFKSITMTEPDELTGSLAPSIFNGGWNIGCNGDTSGFISLSMVGGTAGYQFLWSTGDTTQNIFNLGAGFYSVTVTDPNGCEFRETITLTEPPLLLASINSPVFIGGWNISCAGGSNGIDSLDVQGGTPGYTYNWTGPNAFSASQEDLSGLSAGLYNVTITDNNGCILVKSNSLTAPTPIDITLTPSIYLGGTNVSCFGSNTGFITSEADGGTPNYSYVWTGNGITNQTASSIDSLIAGTYFLTASDTNGCTANQTITITEPAQVAPIVSPVVFAGGFNITCPGAATGLINITDGGGVPPYTYAWTNTTGAFVGNTASIDSLTAGNYTVLVTDANGCDTSITALLNEPLPILATITPSVFPGGSNLSCNANNTGTIGISQSGGTGPYTLNWTGPNGFTSNSSSLSGLSAGLYAVQINDANGCLKQDSIALKEPAVLNAFLSPAVYENGLNIRCFNDSSGVIITTITGGTQSYFYTWTGPNGFTATTSDLVGVIAGQYCLTVSDTNGCIKTDCKNLTQPNSLVSGSLVSPLLAGGFNVACNGSNNGSIYLNFAGGSPGYVIDWRGPNGFTDTSVFFQASNDSIFNLFAGTYSVIVSDTNTCTYTDSITLTQPQNAIIGSLSSLVYNGGNNISCYGLSDGSIDLTPSGGIPPYTYSWSTSASTQDISNLAAGIYSVTITDGINCFRTFSDTLIQPDTVSTGLLSQVYAGGYNITCNGLSNGNIAALVSGGVSGYTYTWSGPGGFSASAVAISNVSAGNYCLTVRDTNACASRQNCINLTQPDVLLLSESHPPTDCSFQPSAIFLTPTGGTPSYSYSWSGPGVGADTTQSVTGLLSGSYSASVSDANGCAAALQNPVVIYVPDSLKMTLSAIVYPPAGYNVSNYGMSDGVISSLVSGGTPVYTYSWSLIGSSFANSSPVIGNLPKGVYILTVKDAYNCILSDTIELREPFELQLPTGFSPNGDGVNDYFLVKGLDAYPDNTLTVFNRWGNKVYTQDDYYKEWTGLSSSGEELPDATYFVVVTINNSNIVLKGYVDLRRY